MRNRLGAIVQEWFDRMWNHPDYAEWATPDFRDTTFENARARIEEREVGEMVEGQNAYRHRRGRPAVTESQVRLRIGSEQLPRLDNADAEAKARGR